MKNLYKKISTIVLAGVVVMGASLSSASAVSFRGQGEAASMSDFAQQERIKILEKKASEEELNEAIKVRIRKLKKSSKQRRRLLELLKEKAVEIKDMQDYERLLKSGKQLHKIKVGDWYYLIFLDEVSVYGASRVPKHKFYKGINQRNYDAMEFYGKKYGAEIILVKDASSSALRVEFDAMIRSMFGHNPKLMNKLLKGADRVFEDVDSFISKIKSGDNIFGNLDKGEFCRLKIGNLEYLIRKR